MSTMPKKINRVVAQKAIDLAPLGIVYLDNDFKIRFVNPAFCHIWGLDDPCHIAGQIFTELPVIKETGMAIVIEARFVSPPFEEPLLFTIINHKKLERLIELLVVPLESDEEGNIEQWILIVNDVTSPFQQRRITQKLYTAVEAAANLIIMTDPEGYITYANPAFLTATGYTMAELKGNTPRLLKSGVMDDEEYRSMWRTISSGKSWSGEFINMTKDRQLLWVRATISPVINTVTNNKIVAYVGVQTDITSKKALEAQLKERSTRYDLLFAHSPMCVAIHRIVFDLNNIDHPVNWVYEDVNPAFLNFFNLSRQQVIGKLATEVFSELAQLESEVHWIHDFARVARTGIPMFIPETANTIGGHTWHVQTSVFRIGHNTVCSMFQDVSAAVEARQNRETLRILQSEFLAIATHEMRTPLAIALGYLGMLKEKSSLLDSESALWVGMAYQKSLDLRELINSTLDIVELQINPGLLTQRFRPVNLAYKLIYAIETLKPLAQARRIKLIPNASNLNLIIDGHEGMLERAIISLLSNAIKFNIDAGLVKASVYTENEEIIIRIEDTGIGIEATEIDNIFEPFRQLEPASTRTHGGIGLGLPLVKSIAQLHKGRIEVSSKPGVGSVFSIVLPYSRQNGAEPPEPNDQ
jgi:PAS domain S-box-containing protein